MYKKFKCKIAKKHRTIFIVKCQNKMSALTARKCFTSTFGNTYNPGRL